MASLNSWYMSYGKDEFHPPDPGHVTWPDNSLRCSKGSIEGWAHDVSGSISVDPRTLLKLSGKRSSLFSVIISCENDVSLEILVTKTATLLPWEWTQNWGRQGQDREREQGDLLVALSELLDAFLKLETLLNF